MAHTTALNDALNEARKLQADGVTDINTIVTASMVVYGSKMLELTEPNQVAMQKRTFRLYVLLVVSMGINLVFSLIAASSSIAYLIDRTH